MGLGDRAGRVVFQPAEEKMESDNPFADGTDRFAVDALLRRYGFRIVSRRGRLLPVWEKDGKRYSQMQALKTIPVDQIDAARQAQQQR
jgi:hypothetical protein